MRAELIGAALLGGLATYLIRYLPLWAGSRLKGRPAPAWARRFLLALGPAAIAALLALSLKDMLPVTAPPGQKWALAAGAAAVLAVLRLTRNPALATLAGAVTYGLAFALATP